MTITMSDIEYENLRTIRANEKVKLNNELMDIIDKEISKYSSISNLDFKLHMVELKIKLRQVILTSITEPPKISPDSPSSSSSSS